MRLTVDEAYKKYADRIFGAAFNVCQNQADADDVVQDTFIKYHSWKKEFSDEEHIKAWLVHWRIAEHKGFSVFYYDPGSNTRKNIS